MTEEEVQPDADLAGDHHGRREQTMVQHHRCPRQQRIGDGLAQLQRSHGAHMPATLNERVVGHAPQAEHGHRNRRQPRTLPVHRLRARRRVAREKHPPHRSQQQPHGHSSHRVPAHRQPQRRGQPCMRRRITAHLAAVAQFKVDALVSRELLHDKREAKLEDDLQRYQTEERVIVTLLGRAQITDDQQNRAGAAGNVHRARQKGIGHGPVHAQTPAQSST